MARTNIIRTIHIEVAVHEVWGALADFGHVYRLSPNIVSSHATSILQQGLGATRHCVLATMGATVEERIVEWKKDEHMAIEIYESHNLPLVKDMKTRFELLPAGNCTELTGAFSYATANLLGSLLNAVTLEQMNTTVWEAFLAGVKHYLETGEEVDQHTPLDTSWVQAA